MQLILISSLCGCALGFGIGSYITRISDEKEMVKLKDTNDNLKTQINYIKKRGRNYDY